MLRWRRCLFVFSRLLVGVGLVGCRIEQAPAFAGRRRPFATEHRFAVLELGRRIRIRGVLAVLEPFTFFLSSSFFLFSASNALTAAACCVFSSSKFDPVLAIDSVKVASWPGNSLSSSRPCP